MPSTFSAKNQRGLTTAEAPERLKQFWPNAVAEDKSHPLQQFIKRFWAWATPREFLLHF
jgi:hypothetical protein